LFKPIWHGIDEYQLELHIKSKKYLCGVPRGPSLALKGQKASKFVKSASKRAMSCFILLKPLKFKLFKPRWLGMDK
jgi:hypothetical protein